MDTNQIKSRIAEIKEDERLSYPSANVFTNAPLAIIQIGLATELQTLEKVLGIPLSAIPLTKNKRKK